MMHTGRSGTRRQRHPEAGSTLIEIMAALVILTIAMTAVFATFTTQQQSFTAQSRVAEMQQNLRIAADYMFRDLRMAGYGLPDNVAVPAGANLAGITTIRAIFAVDNTTGPDQVYVLYLFDMDANQPPTVNTALMASAGSVTVDNAAGFLSTGGELVLVTDASTADIFLTTSVAGNALSFGGIYGTIGHTLYGTGPPASTVAKARFVRYFIDASDPAHPALMVDRNIPGQDPQPVADDVEDLQLAYGLDTNGDGVVDQWRNDGGAVLAAAEVPQVRQVRLNLLARSRLPDRGWSETRPALLNRAGGGAADGYRRRAIDVMIDLRNSGAGT